ncbi:MAG: hypothetical protein AB7N65_23295, partial [Vicinamibacterales bacterium]
IEGVRTGVASPFFSGNVGVNDARDREGSILVEHSRFKSYIGVVVGTGYANGSTGTAKKSATVRASSFEGLSGVPESPLAKPSAISVNYQMAPGDTEPRAPVQVVDFNNQPGDNFKVYYSLSAPVKTAPCQNARDGVDGWVCQ